MANPNWVAGQGGNPAGRPKGHGVSWFLAKIGDEKVPDGKSKKEYLAYRLFETALDPEITTKDLITISELIMDRLEGKAVSTNLNADITQNPFDGIDTAKLEALKAKLLESKSNLGGVQGSNP